jgi:hypothetical protein
MLWTKAIRLSQAHGSATILLYGVAGKTFVFHFATNEDANKEAKVFGVLVALLHHITLSLVLSIRARKLVPTKLMPSFPLLLD